jgi:hypothetical protein
MRKEAFAWVVVALVAVSVPAQEAPVARVEEGVLDSIELYVQTPPKGVPVVIRPFAADKADLGTGAEGGKDTRVAAAKMIQANGPKLLASSFVAELTKRGGYADVREDDGSPIPPDAIVVEGAFVQLNPGSKAKRYWAGFGSGKSGTTVEGVVKDGSGRVLAKFRQKRIAVMGMFGGDYEKKLTSDCKSIGEDIAKFLADWAAGKPLK